MFLIKFCKVRVIILAMEPVFLNTFFPQKTHYEKWMTVILLCWRVPPVTSLLPPPPTYKETFQMPQSTLEAGGFCHFSWQEIVNFFPFVLAIENVGA